MTEARADPDAAVWPLEADLSDPDAPARLIGSAAATSRFLDILICNHARSGGDGPLGTLTAGMLDAHWAVNTRACPITGGLLSGKYRRDGSGTPEGSRHLDFRTGTNLRSTTGRSCTTLSTCWLRSARQARGVSAAQVALAWLISKPAVTSVIVGARTEEQLIDDLASAKLVLTDEEISMVRGRGELPTSALPLLDDDALSALTLVARLQ